jgi:putative transposase
MKNIEFKPTNYPSDLTDKEWLIIESFFPYGNKSGYHKRSLINAVFYIEKSGCQWRMLPHDYPPYETVWSFYRRARENGLWEKIMDALVMKVRQSSGRKPTPTYGIIDSQSAKTTSASDDRGFDGGKKS